MTNLFNKCDEETYIWIDFTRNSSQNQLPTLLQEKKKC